MKVNLPLSTDILNTLKAGDTLLLSGDIFVMRDAAHKKIYDLIKQGKPLPIDLMNATIYYMGPCPKTSGKVIGSAGPTTSKRMDAFAPTLYDNGVKVTIGKGGRAESVRQSIQKNNALYLVAVGGAGAYYSNAITSYEIVAYPELLSEAIAKITVKDFAVIVAIDCTGKSL